MVMTTSLLSQPLHHFPCTEIVSPVKKLRAERHAKGFTCWNPFVSMPFRHLARADSPREICGGLSCCLGESVIWGSTRRRAIRRFRTPTSTARWRFATIFSG